MPTTVVARRTRTATKSTHPLARLIPDEWYGQDYVSRNIGDVVDLDIIQQAREYKHNTLIEGPTGSAKTSLVMAAAAGATGKTRRRKVDGEWTYENVIDDSMKRPVVYVPCNGAIEPSQFFGRWVPTPDGKFAFEAGEITLAAMYGGIIYLDEVNFAPPKIMSVLHGAMDKRRTIVLLDAAGSTTPTVIQLHDDCQIIATYNNEYEGTRPLNEAFKNRFAFKLQFSYDPTVEESLIVSTSLMKVAGELRRAYTDGELRTPISTNMLMELEEFAVNPALGFAFAMENFLAAFAPDEKPAVLRRMELSANDIRRDLLDDDAPTANAGEPTNTLGKEDS